MKLNAKSTNFLFAVFAIAIVTFVWPTTIANLQIKPSDTTYQVKIDLDETIVLPKLCKGKLWRGYGKVERLGYDGRTDVSVSVSNGDGIPLNYNYSVTGGRVMTTGSTGMWDLAALRPGKYQITVTVDDGVGNSGLATKTVQLAEAFFGCPCRCPSTEIATHYTEVKPGDVVDFEVRTWGGDFVDGGPKYYWHVTKGTIESGQGTQVISVRATGERGEMVTATAEIGGIDPNCTCAHIASESVLIGAETKSRTLPLAVRGLWFDEETVYIDCAPGISPRSGTPSSDDLIVAVRTSAVSNSVNDKLTYTYSTTGGKVIGSSANVKWDLTDLQPGTYSISVGVDDGKSVSEVSTKVLTLMESDCGGHVYCPHVELFPIKRVSNSNDLIVVSSIRDGWTDIELRWNAVGAEVIAGQGTPLVRLRPKKSFKLAESSVTLNVQYPREASFCPSTFTQPLTAPSPEL